MAIPPDAKPDALIGTTLVDKYKIGRELGRGGMGVVYEAEHLGLGKRVAIKMMLEKYAEDGDAISRFKREALAASRIGNPHIIDIADLGVAPDGRSFVVMELLQGVSLAHALRDGRLAQARALEIMRQTLRAVGAAHAAGIIHRDLKPDNIFLIPQGDGVDFVKLLDFGISRAIDQAAEIAKTKLTTTGTVMGTPLYMSPEQAMGEPADARADVYALGVILYEMLAGVPPFAGVTLAVLMMKLLSEPPRSLSELRADVPPHVVAAVHRALEKEPAKRFASCEAFLAAVMDKRVDTSKVTAQMALDQTIAPADALVIAKPSPQTEQTSDVVAAAAVGVTARPPRRLGAWTFVLAAVAGAAIVGGVVIAMQRSRAEPPIPPPLPAVTAVVAAPLPVPVPSAPTPTLAPTSAPRDAAVDAPAMAIAPAPRLAPAKTVKPPTPNPATTLDDIRDAIKRRDGKGCLAKLAMLASPGPPDIEVESAHATCEMLVGNCAVGEQEVEQIYKRQGTDPAAAKLAVEQYCPVADVGDAAARLARLSTQINSVMDFDCAQYIGPARELAKTATTPRDRLVMGSVLARIATCYSHHDDCDTAHKVLAEAQGFIPALATNELAPKCR